MINYKRETVTFFRKTITLERNSEPFFFQGWQQRDSVGCSFIINKKMWLQRLKQLKTTDLSDFSNSLMVIILLWLDAHISKQQRALNEDNRNVKDETKPTDQS